MAGLGRASEELDPVAEARAAWVHQRSRHILTAESKQDTRFHSQVTSDMNQSEVTSAELKKRLGGLVISKARPPMISAA